MVAYHNEDCPDNCGCKIRISRNETEIENLWAAINGMKTWVIIGMGTVVLQGALFVGGFFVNYFKSKGAL